MAFDFAGDDCNTPEMIAMVMQNFGEDWSKQVTVWSM